MLSEVFYWIFNMSIVATVTGTVVILIRAIRFIPRRVAIFLWIAPFLRMCVPFGISSPYSLLSLLSDFFSRTVVIFSPAEDISVSLTNSMRLTESYFPIRFSNPMFETLFAVASVVWIAVALAIVVFLVFVYLSTKKMFKDARRLRENIYLSEKAKSPAVYGVIKARIILPLSYEEKDLNDILLHEQTHIRRKDNLWRLLAIILTAVHWFNPFMWIFLRLFLSDIELSCDEAVITKLNKEDRKRYARTLLSVAEEHSLLTSPFSGAKIGTRVRKILSYRKITLFSLICLIVLVACVIMILITNAR